MMWISSLEGYSSLLMKALDPNRAGPSAKDKSKAISQASFLDVPLNP